MSAILVTGGCGYIGSHCALSLFDSGYDVIILDDFSTGSPSIGKSLESSSERIRIAEGSLLIPADIDQIFDNGDIGAVIHLAGSSQVAESVSDPGKYYRNNVVGTVNLLESMRLHGIGKIVFSSSAAIYGEPEYVPIDESHPLNPINPYGMSKLIVERILEDYDRAYGMKSVRLRYFNAAGADSKGRAGECHEPETHLIPCIIRSVLDGNSKFSLFGGDYDTRDGTCVRDYVNVEDLAEAHLLALRYLDAGGESESFNLGTSSGSTVKEVLASCEKTMGKPVPTEIRGRRQGDPAILIADNRKAREILGWEPKRTLEDSVRTAYAWELRRRGLTSSP
jgi:UDP-glucose 4-epimerase